MLSFWPLGAFIMAFGLYLMQKNIFGNKFEYWSHIEMGSSNEKQYEKAFDGGWFLWQMNTPIIPRALCVLEKARKKTSENWPKHLHLKAEVARKKSKWTLALLSHSKPKQGKSKGVYTKKPNVIHKLINFRNSSDLLDLIELFFQLSKWRTTEKQLNPIHFFN